MNFPELERLNSQALEHIAASLDLTEAQYKLAKEKYEIIGNNLSSEKSILRKYSPQILPQGSIRYGTSTQPIGGDDEFDVDVTCRLNTSLPEVQKEIKSQLGKSLVSAGYEKMLKEKRRCWRIQYADSTKFHIDIVPSLPDKYDWLLSQGIPFKYAQHALAITDNENKNYPTLSSEWPKSNPEGYALWFLDVMKEQADKIRMAKRAELLLEKVEEVPEFKVRTPLQRAIQIMKRHRDLTIDNKDSRPVSIIITTLAARAYEQIIKKPSSSKLFKDLLIEMVELMPTFIVKKNDEDWIENPVDTKENFADKWKNEPAKQKAFNKWLASFKDVIIQASRKPDVQSFFDYLKPFLGVRTINEASLKMGGNQLIKEASTSSAVSIFNAPHRQKPLWPVKLDYIVSVRGKYRSKKVWEWFELDHSVIPKDCEIEFVASTNVPEPFTVFWQVVNTGTQAENAGGLRGNIFSAKTYGRGGLRQIENSLYTGTHWIECFVVKNGECVARSREYIVNIQ